MTETRSPLRLSTPHLKSIQLSDPGYLNPFTKQFLSTNYKSEACESRIRSLRLFSMRKYDLHWVSALI
jgi:hypothetical protein